MKTTLKGLRQIADDGTPLGFNNRSICSPRVALHSPAADWLANTASVRNYARELANNVSPRSLRVIKQQVYNALFQGLGEAIDAANAEMLQSFRCDDFKEGVAHFLEKRPPHFTGR